ncbi:tetratricopeptide repeat protein [candidate division KSB1 bacterium]|nr:tetratricopeptide repeat protein [candidate division KSB1 bacterium]
MTTTSNEQITTLLTSLLNENEELIRYLINFLEILKELKSDEPSLTEAQADSFLKLTYKHYHDDNRTLDIDGRNLFLPIIQDAGFLGVLLTLGDILRFKQNETDERVNTTLDELARELNNSAIRNDIYCNLVVRFFGKQGQEWIKQLSEEAIRFEELRREAELCLEEGSRSSVEKGLQLLDQAVEIPWPSCKAWHQRGLALYRLKRYEEAIYSYHKSISLNEEVLPKITDNDTSWVFWSCEDLKWCYEKSNTQEDGWKYFDTLICNEQKSKWWIVWHERGFMAWKTGKLEEAIASYVRAIELHRDPSWTHSSGDLWACIRDHHAYARGVEVFSELIQKFDDYWILPHFKGWLERALDHPSEAVHSYQKAIELHGVGGWFWSWQDLGNIYSEDLRDYANAIRAYANAIKRGEAEENEQVWKARQGLVSVLTQDRAILRKLLVNAFSDEELTDLCFDYFRPVYENFASGMSKGAKTRRLLDYCIRQDQIEILLELVEKQNPGQYNHFLGLD